MKKILFILLLLFMVTALMGMQKESETKSQVETDTSGSPKNVLKAEDLQKFYIGISEFRSGKKLVTLDIKSFETAGEKLKFWYTLNSISDREEGEGTISLEENTIMFSELETGKIYRGQDGKIIFESTSRDSSKYWKMKEK